MLNISSRAYDKANQAILVTGSARSGTTIIGKVIHSLSGVEYAYEPPVLFSLFPLISKIPEDQWKLLYETYLYEEHFINAIAGRNLNCNKCDDSSIYQVKSNSDIETRLNKSTGKAEAEEMASAMTIAYKMPDIVPHVPQLIKYYPSTRVVMVHRGYIETLNSLSKKEWFTNENSNKNLLWPFTKYKNIQIPFWVKESDHDAWQEMTALDRCAYYYLEMVQNIDAINNRIDVRYDELIADPVSTIEGVANRLSLSFGPKTLDVLASIKNTKSDRSLSILDGVDSSLRDKILLLSEQSNHCFA